jgi:hypothetical protein
VVTLEQRNPDVLVASLDEKADIGIHKPDLHRHILAVRQDSALVHSPFLDKAEYVIPAPTVQPTRVVSQFEEDLLHLEGSRESLDQDSSTDGTKRHANVGLREVEDVIPKAGFAVVFHFGEVEVGAGTTSNKLLGIVEEVEGEVEE